MENNLALRLLFMAFALMLLPLSGAARAETAGAAVYSARAGVAIGGYDPVAFFEQGAAQPGRRGHAVMWKGVVWRFATARNQARFEANPRAYAPAFGGYCAFAMSQGRLMHGDPLLWAIVDGELYLLNNPDARDFWAARRGELIARAQLHWPVILQK